MIDRSVRYILWWTALIIVAGIGGVFGWPLLWAPAGQLALITAVYWLGRPMDRARRYADAPPVPGSRRRITEFEFRRALARALEDLPKRPAAVTGPGRSGAIASVYASHLLGVPWLPYGQRMPLRPLLVIDTAEMSGRTLRKAVRRTGADMALAVYREPRRLRFWYER